MVLMTPGRWSSMVPSATMLTMVPWSCSARFFSLQRVPRALHSSVELAEALSSRAPGTRSATGSSRSSSARPCIHSVFCLNCGHFSNDLRSCSICAPLIFIACCIIEPNSVDGSIRPGMFSMLSSAIFLRKNGERRAPRRRLRLVVGEP